MSDARISPTAHFTATVWARNGLAHPALVAAASPWLFRGAGLLLGPLSRLTGSPSVEATLLHRHHGIDRILTRVIEDEGLRQVVEVPGGLASRGARFVARYPDLLYVEGDLPGMAEHKRRAFARAGYRQPRHRVVDLDLLATDGPLCLEAAVGPDFDPTAPTALITEGLLYYFQPPAVRAVLQRASAFLRRSQAGHFFADLALGGPDQDPLVRAFLLSVSVVARGRVQAHFDGTAGALAALQHTGFTQAQVLPALGDALGRGDPQQKARIHLIDAAVYRSEPAHR
jgi:O-methyltransferase involved in polyketide biosynthesis